MSRFYFADSGEIIDFEKVVALDSVRHWNSNLEDDTPAIKVYFVSKDSWTFFDGEEKKLLEAYIEYASSIDPNVKVPFECGTCGKEGRQKASNKTCPGCGSPLRENDEQ